MKPSGKSRPDIDTLFQGVVDGDRVLLGQSITLIESRLPSDQTLATALLEKILPLTGKSIRIGITGIPGVGKSTFIEAISKHILDESKKLAVLSVDPSSPLTGGSILGDKTRMDTLSRDQRAFVRPTASSTASGGVAFRTRESMLLCEAAGYDVIIVETVGVGQSELAVNGMVDFFLLLMLSGAGDELQGIKKGIMELADAIVITKSDGSNIEAARKARATYQSALHIFSSSATEVMACSAVTGEGLAEVWNLIQHSIKESIATGGLQQKRSEQNVSWFKDQVGYMLNNHIQQTDDIRALETQLIEDLRHQKISPRLAAENLLRLMLKR